MKFPSLIRLTKNKKFNYGPRHYDPVKEDLEQRISKIKHEKKRNLPHNFFKKNKEKGILKPGNLQFFLILLLSFISIGWLFYGNIIFLLLVTIPLIYFLKLNKKI